MIDKLLFVLAVFGAVSGTAVFVWLAIDLSAEYLLGLEDRKEDSMLDKMRDWAYKKGAKNDRP